MSIFNHTIDQEEIVRKYFSDPDKKIVLERNEVLIYQNETNTKLFYIKKGKLSGFLPDKHLTEPVFEAHERMFIGVYSYFSGDHKSYSRVIATEPSEVYYCDIDPRQLALDESDEFLGFLFNIVVLELRSRQHFAAEMANDRQEALNKLIKTEKLITLGQLSAGLAHELNNTIGSLSSNLRQLENDVKNLLIGDKSSKMKSFFKKGLEEGLQLSSSEARKARNKWSESLKLDLTILKKLVKAGISPNEIKGKEEALEASALWNLGYILHDMKVASDQAAHVISSIKTMGIGNQKWSKEVDVNSTINEAIAILRSATRTITLSLDLDETIPTIEACHGELVQIWVNLVKNAIESLNHHQVDNPSVKIRSKETSKHIKLQVEDNGVGIDPAIIEKIYQPSFTTKVEGISLGLGLGLTIVQRIISEHEGEISVKSEFGKTRFTVLLPKNQNN